MEEQIRELRQRLAAAILRRDLIGARALAERIKVLQAGGS